MNAIDGVERVFYGRIGRSEAETILNQHSCKDGLYLLRSLPASEVPGGFVLSLKHKKTSDGHCFAHIPILYDADKSLHVSGYDGAAASLSSLLVNLKGNPTRYMLSRRLLLRAACEHNGYDFPVRFFGITERVWQEELEAFGVENPKLPRNQLERSCARSLHFKQPWFFDTCDVLDVTRQQTSLRNGQFLTRLGKDGNFVVHLFSDGCITKYKIRHTSGGLQLDGDRGTPFDSLVELIDYHHTRDGGLGCLLDRPFDRPQYAEVKQTESATSVYDKHTADPSLTYENSCTLSLPRSTDLDVESSLACTTSHAHASTKLKRHLSHPQTVETSRTSGHLTGPRRTELPANFNLRVGSVYRAVTSVGELVTSQCDVLASGHFGTVYKAYMYINGNLETVAVKTLLHSNPNTVEMEREAHIMCDVTHPNVVKMLQSGVTADGRYAIVLEYMAHGSLKNVLDKVRERELHETLDLSGLLRQVASGMDYLAQRHVVHRDLAARNVLMVTLHRCKVADFGLSRMTDNAVYVASGFGDWPVRWYAPESLTDFVFTSSSDVWSYGVTMWEAYSLGLKPYANIAGCFRKFQQKLASLLLDQQLRLEKPQDCSRGMYRLMKKCWYSDPDSRPDFAQLESALQRLETSSTQTLPDAPPDPDCPAPAETDRE